MKWWVGGQGLVSADTYTSQWCDPEMPVDKTAPKTVRVTDKWESQLPDHQTASQIRDHLKIHYFYCWWKPAVTLLALCAFGVATHSCLWPGKFRSQDEPLIGMVSGMSSIPAMAGSLIVFDNWLRCWIDDTELKSPLVRSCHNTMTRMVTTASSLCILCKNEKSTEINNRLTAVLPTAVNKLH